MKYKSRLLADKIERLDLEDPTNVNLFTALELIAACWTNVSGETIRNCFRHAGCRHDVSFVFA